MTHKDIDYYQRRAEQERDSAARTEDTIARRVHQEMAERYSARVSEMATILPRQHAQV